MCARQEHADNNMQSFHQRQVREDTILHQTGSMKTPEALSSPASSDMRLARLHSHSRDHRIVFSEDTHTYTLDNAKVFPISVSGVWNKFFAKFDAQEIVDTHFPNWLVDPYSKYFNQIQENLTSGHDEEMIKSSIIAGWTKIGQAASSHGTFVHRQIELFLNEEDHCQDGKEFEHFRNFLKDFATPRGWVSKWPRLLVIRTLDKLWALCGISMQSMPAMVPIWYVRIAVPVFPYVSIRLGIPKHSQKDISRTRSTIDLFPWHLMVTLTHTA